MNSKIKYVISLFLVVMIAMVGGASAESISGYILDSEGAAIVGADVADNASVGSTTTDSNGYYTIVGYTNLSSYIIEADNLGYVDNTLTVDVNGDMTNQNITLVTVSLTTFISDAETVATSVSSITTSVLSIFMEPPLVYFIGLIIFGLVARMVRNFLRRGQS